MEKFGKVPGFEPQNGRLWGPSCLLWALWGQNAGFYAGVSKVLRRGPGQVWLARRSGPARRAPECWYGPSRIEPPGAAKQLPWAARSRQRAAWSGQEDRWLTNSNQHENTIS